MGRFSECKLRRYFQYSWVPMKESPNFRRTERCLFPVWEHKAQFCSIFCFETLIVFSVAEFDDLHRSDICYRKIDLRH
jgi:hypothetical protein